MNSGRERRLGVKKEVLKMRQLEIDLDRMGPMMAVLLRPPKAHWCMAVDAALVQEEVLMYLHEGCGQRSKWGWVSPSAQALIPKPGDACPGPGASGTKTLSAPSRCCSWGRDMVFPAPGPNGLAAQCCTDHLCLCAQCQAGTSFWNQGAG